MNLAPTGCDDIHNRKRLILLLRAKIRKKDTKFYLDICMETGREDVVLKYFQDARGRTNGKYS